MNSTLQGEQDREESPAPNAQDAREGVGHEESAQQENAYVELHSAFEDDSDEDPNDVGDDDASLPTNNNAHNPASRIGSQDDENEDTSWLGATDEDVNATTGDLSANDDRTPSQRPHDLILDQTRKRSRDQLEPEQGPEDQLEPEVSPRTRKRLRLEREKGFSYDQRPMTLVRGWQIDFYDPVGGIGLRLPSHYLDTEKNYGGGSPKKPEYLQGRRMGEAMPAYPDLPRRPSPLGQDAHRDGNWKGIPAIPLPEDEDEDAEDEYIPPSPIESEWPTYRNDEDEDHNTDESKLPRPSSPAPDYDDEEDFHDDQERDDTTLSEDQNDSSPSEVDCNNESHQDDRRTSLTFEVLLDSIKPLMKNWADENEEDDSILSSAFDSTAFEPPSSSLNDDTTTEKTLTSDSINEDQESEHIDQNYPKSNNADVELTASSSTSDSDEASPSKRPPPLERHPSSKETGREIGQLSKPLPRDEELTQLRLENAKLALEIVKEKKQYEDRKRRADKEHNELITAYKGLHADYRNLQISHREFGEIYRKLTDSYYELQYTHDGECLAIKQRAEYDAEQLMVDRVKQDAERLAYINTLKAEATSMRIWAEGLDDDAEPMRLSNDNLKAKSEAADKANEVLKAQLNDANTSIAELKAEVREIAVQGVRMIQLCRESIANAAGAPRPTSTPVSTTPSSPSTTSPSSPRTPSPTPAILPPLGESREAREARWRNLGASRVKRDIQRKARNAADTLYDADRELRLQAYTAATGLVYVEVDIHLRREKLMRIVDEYGKARRRNARVVQG